MNYGTYNYSYYVMHNTYHYLSLVATHLTLSYIICYIRRENIIKDTAKYDVLTRVASNRNFICNICIDTHTHMAVHAHMIATIIVCENAFVKA